MKLYFLPVDFQFKFISPVMADNDILFVMRSVFGAQLKKMCCVSRQSNCFSCMYNKTCAFAYLFESVVKKDNCVLPGRKTISHPYSISKSKVVTDSKGFIKSFEFNVVLFGKAIEYLPYFYAAFVRAGKEGVFKRRTPFEVTDVKVRSQSILLDKNQLRSDYKSFCFDFLQKSPISAQELLIEAKTPLRFKVRGVYTQHIIAQDFWNCLYRRAKTLALAYGVDNHSNDFPHPMETKTTIVDNRLQWKDITHYSSRQKQAIELGGFMGTLKIAGSLNNLEGNLLEFAKIANIGKSTNFGLGQIDCWER